MCFFLYTETKSERAASCGNEVRKSDWVIALLWRWRSRPGCHLAEQTLYLCWTDRGFVEAEPGTSVLFMWSGAQSSLRKKTSHHLRFNLSQCASNHGCKVERSNVSSRVSLQHKTSGSKDTHTHTPARTHKTKPKSGTPISSKHSNDLSVHS